MIPQKVIFCFLGISLVFLTNIDKVFAQSNDSFTVYVFLLDECRICQEVAPELNQIYKITNEAGIGFSGFFPNKSSSETGIEKFRKKYKILFPLATDYNKDVSKRFSAKILPEVVLWNETKNEVVYRGMVNNLYYAPGKRRHQIDQHYLKDAIFAIEKGNYPGIKTTTPIGCFINYLENPF